MIRAASLACLLLWAAPPQDVPAPPPGPYSPVTRLLDAQNKVAALDFLQKNNFYVPASTAEELQREEREALDEAGSDGTAYDFTAVSDAIAGMDKAEKEKDNEIQALVGQWLHKAVEQGADQVELYRWFDSWKADFDKGRGLKALMVARRFAELEKAKPALNLHQVLTSVGTVYGGRKAEAMKDTNTLVKYLVAVEKHREVLRRQLQMVQFVKTGLKTVEFMNDPVGEISKKAKEMITETAEERGYDKETVEFVMKTVESLVKNASEVYTKWEAVRLDTKVNIPDSVKRTARNMAVVGAVFKVFKDLGENDANKPYLAVLDYYISALDLPWQMAQKMAEFMRKADQLEAGWRGIGVWKKILDENGDIELDPIAEEFGVKIARTSNVPDETAVWYLGLSDKQYVALTWAERSRLIRVLAAERLINAWYDGSDWFWERWWKKTSRLNPWSYAVWIEAMIDSQTYSDKDRADYPDKVRKVARASGLSPTAQEFLAKNRPTGIKIKGKPATLTAEELLEQADETLREIGTAEFIREALLDVPKDAKHSYGWFRHALSSSGLAFDRKQLLNLFNNFVRTGSDAAKFTETLRKIREDRAYANLEFGIPRMLVGGNDSVRRGDNPTLLLSLSVDGLPARFEAPGTIRWEGPEGVEMPAASEIRLANGVRHLSFKIRITDKASHKEQRIVARIDVPLARGGKAEAWREWFFDVADAPAPPTPVKVRPVDGRAAVEFRSDALKSLKPNDRPLDFRLYHAPAPHGPWAPMTDFLLFPGAAEQKPEEQKQPLILTGKDTAALLDPWEGRFKPAPSYYKVAQLLGPRGSRQKEIVSEPLPPSAPRITVEYDHKVVPDSGLSVPEFRGAMMFFLRLGVEEQHVSYAGCKFTVTDGKRTWYGWSGRREGPLTAGFVEPSRALILLATPIGETTFRIKAESREGMTAERTLVVRIAPPDAAAVLERGSAAVEDHHKVREIPKMQAYYDEQMAFQKRKLAELETKYKDKKDPNYVRERRGYLGGLASYEAGYDGRDHRLWAMTDCRRLARAAGLYDRALELQKKVLEEIPEAEARALGLIRRQWAINSSEGPVEPGEEENHRKFLENTARSWRYRLSEELTFGLQDALAAADIATFHAWTLRLIEVDPEGAYPRNYVVNLANAEAEIGGDRDAAKRWYVKYLQLQAGTSSDPKAILDRQYSGNVPAWWPDPRVADRPKPRPDPKPEPKKPELRKPAEPTKPVAPPTEPAKPSIPVPAAASAAVAEGDAALQKKDPAGAIRAFGKAIELAPQSPGPRLKRAEANLILGKYAEAVADLEAERALGERPEVAAALADALISSGKADDGLRVLDKTGAADASAQALRGRALLQKGDAKGAAAKFAEAAALDPKLGETHYGAAGLALEQKAFSRALPLYEAVEGLLPAQPGSHYGRAIALTGVGRKDDAIEAYRRYLDFDAGSPWAANARAGVLALLGGPGDVAGSTRHYQAAVAGWTKGDVAAAIMAYDRAIAQDRSSYRAHVGRGLAFAFLGRHGEAIADYRMANALTPAAGDIPVETLAHYRTEALLLAGRLDDADRLLRTIEGRTAQGHGLRGMILIRKGDRAAAAASFAQARAMDANMAQFYYSSAGGRLNHRNFEDALMYCDGLELMDATIGAVHYTRGSALAGLGRKAEAIASYNRYLEFDSRSDWAKRARQAIAELRR